ncbi:MAG: 16S rRNA pseudouridine(516) synthase [Methylophilaceae bacterium 17-44-8]|jgi:16S rRNA pseudouridine516 synthase|nr:MAG: 16S rRNA pseudouridine(516) synthase [Methylophilales bacterium 28-44-11]OZA04516.1 MAG: 16S rRNA pseudouridine(516) synthase [Methylophilaceae bacterium 17-44-8]
MAKKLDIERILCKQGFGTRKQCRIMILNEEITVNGALCDDPDTEFSLENLHFTIRGEQWDYHAQSYLMMHKPSNYECSHKTQHHPTIYSLLPHPLVERGVQCIGRLDEDTTGLILISDDGQFIHRMSSPKHKVPKVYEVTCKHPIDDTQIAHILSGVQLIDEDAPIAALACERVNEHVIHMTLAEGKYHQVKRMVAAISNRVEGLKRIQIGQLRLPDDLNVGEWRWLSDQDIDALSTS